MTQHALGALVAFCRAGTAVVVCGKLAGRAFAARRRVCIGWSVRSAAAVNRCAAVLPLQHDASRAAGLEHARNSRQT